MQERISQTNAPPDKGEAGPRAPTRDKTKSGATLSHSLEDVYPDPERYPLYKIVGTLNGDRLYLPESPSLRGPAIERMLETTAYLGAVSSEELEAWFKQQVIAGIPRI